MTRAVIPMFSPYMSARAIERASEVLRTPMIGQGAIVDEFEQAICTRLGLSHTHADGVFTVTWQTTAPPVIVTMEVRPTRTNHP